MPPRIPLPPPDGRREAAHRLRLGAEARICGVDEAGRGPWAGPVYAGACILDPEATPEGLNDSKALSAKRRRELDQALRAGAEIGVGWASVEEIDRMGLGRAADLAMARAVAALPRPPCFALVDGKRVPSNLGVPAEPLISGDALCLSISAASILAKVARDLVMDALAADHPDYGWETNRGYGTAAHQAALKRWGVTLHHRRSFQPIHNILLERLSATA